MNERFIALWYSGGPDYAPNRCIGRTELAEETHHGAVMEAARMMLEAHPATEMAKGFYVKKENAS